MSHFQSDLVLLSTRYSFYFWFLILSIVTHFLALQGIVFCVDGRVRHRPIFAYGVPLWYKLTQCTLNEWLTIVQER